MSMILSRLLAAMFVAALAVAGCGGGSGGGGGGSSSPPGDTTPPPPPTSVTKTVTCPTGVSQTATAADDAAATAAANALCPAATITVVPANGSASVSVNATVVLTSNAVLTNESSSLKAGGVTNVALVVSKSADGKVLTLTPTGLLNYVQQYTATRSGTDALGRTVSATSTFTTTVAPPPTCVAPKTLDTTTNTCKLVCTPPLVANAAGDACVAAPVTCTAPAQLNSANVCISPPAVAGYTWNAAVKVWVADMGTKVFTANQLPAGCTAASQQCWKDAVASGLVKLVATSATMTGYNTRPIMFAYFRNTSVAFGVTGLWNTLPIYADDGSLVGSDIFGGGSSEVDWGDGNTNGVISHDKTTGNCAEMYYYAQGSTWSSRPVTCP